MPNTGAIFFHFHQGIETGKRPPLVLLHGAGGSHLYWPPEIRRLPGYCVYALDLPGHGKSNGSGQQSIQLYCDVVIQWLIDNGLTSAIFAGHSMGGAIALSLALNYPENVIGLALIGSGAHFQIESSLLENTSTASTFEVAVKQLVDISFSPNASEELKSQAYGRLIKTRFSVLHGDLQACSVFDVRESLPGIHQPTLVIIGNDDRLTPLRHAHFLEANIQDSQLVVIPGTGHMVMLEQPQLVAESLLTFISRIPY